MKFAHQFALDIFFYVKRAANGVETGPNIYSISNGIVVSVESNWKGNETESGYKSGGLSPKAGNGVIIYCPSENRYYDYFHLKECVVKLGQAVSAGDKIGLGGNTGTNAFKSGHGNHVHVEIIEASGKPWPAKKIKTFIDSVKK